MKKGTYENEYREIIRRLKQARLEAGLTQVEVAKNLGKPQSYVSKIESGERRLDIAEFKILLEILNKASSFFFEEN